MADVCKRVIDAVTAVMAEGAAGFNAQFALIQGDYGIAETCALDFTTGSNSVIFAELSRAGADVAAPRGRVTLRVGTGMASWTGEAKGVKWSGRVACLMDFRVLYSERLDGEDTVEDEALIEGWADALFDAAIEVFSQPVDWGRTYGVVLAELPSRTLYQAEPLEDGFRVDVQITAGFKVDAA